MSKWGYPIIGGPLDGQWGNWDDFQNSGYGGTLPGVHYPHRAEYTPFNRADGQTRGRGKKHNGPASMIWLHKSLLQPMIRRS